ncbi:hypothetical protein AY600_14085 [Phormidium willei BDU 130791]|nr:hypothetical protein AY600_14085 [Phormidium willei BDU 130791]
MRTSKLPITGLIILGVLALFLVQNSSPSLSITFFGVTSIALPLGIWLLIPFLAGVMSAGFVALLLPRGDRSSRHLQASGTMESARNPQPSSRQLREDAIDDPDLDEDDVAVEAQESPGKTSASDTPITPERRWTSSAPRRPEGRYDVPPSGSEDVESEVWDEEDWPEEEEWPDDTEENPSGVAAGQAVGNYEVHKEPVSAYRQGTLYSYSYSKSALEEVSEPETSQSETSQSETSARETSARETSKTNISEANISDSEPSAPEISEVNISEPSSVDSQPQDSASNVDQIEGLDPSVKEETGEDDIISPSDSTPPFEEEDEPDETLEGEFLDDFNESKSEQKPSSFLRSKLFNFKDKDPQDDDWSDPPTPPKDW